MKIKFRICYCLLFLLTLNMFGSPGPIDLIPKPKSVLTGNAPFKLPRVFRISDQQWPGSNFAQFVNSAGLPGIDFRCVNSSAASCEIRIKKTAGKETAESYILEISPKGIEISASGYAGVLYAIETLNQVLIQTWNGKEFDLPGMVIQDEPSFSYRGFMLDASRHFQPVATVKHVLDYMLSMKLNIFHWHLSDDEGWRIQSLKHPELNSIGSFMNDSDLRETNGFYTLEEIRDIQKYAHQRNIEIIPECDIPGHSTAILDAFPALRCPNRPDSKAYCAGNPKSLEIIRDIFGEIIDVFKPKYIHIGGDERQKDLWNQCDLCKAKMVTAGVTNENDLQNKMLLEISAFIHSKGVKTISWAENLGGGIADGQIIQSWRLREEAYTAIKMGHQVINSDNQETYLDYPENEIDAKSKPSWMVVLPVEKVYNFDPIPSSLTQAEQKLVLGSECPLWTESITIDKIYPQIKDRLEAHAEKCWTPKEQKSYGDFVRRMNNLRVYFRFQFYRAG
jgi:hexosaminidase